MTVHESFNHTLFRCAQLEFDLALGVVKNGQGESQRFSPINLKLLGYLLNHHGSVISRADLFDAIWPNQIVSDDVLTRAISDIRTQLAKLDVDSKFIETIPKRGYRWMLEAYPQRIPNSDSPKPELQSPSSLPIAQSPKTHFFKTALIYLSLAAVLAMAATWCLMQAMTTRVISLAVLPAQANRPSIEPTAKVLDDALLHQLRKNSNIQLLSQTAIASRPRNPFPYFFNEFNAQWVLESRVTDFDGIEKIELSLVDARTGVEQKNISFDVANRNEIFAKIAQKLDSDLLIEQLPY